MYKNNDLYVLQNCFTVSTQVLCRPYVILIYTWRTTEIDFDFILKHVPLYTLYTPWISLWVNLVLVIIKYDAPSALLIICLKRERQRQQLSVQLTFLIVRLYLFDTFPRAFPRILHIHLCYWKIRTKRLGTTSFIYYIYKHTCIHTDILYV